MSKFAEIKFLGFVVSALFIGITVHPAWSDGESNEELTTQDVPAALHLLRPLAERGDAEAQYRVGQIYEEAPTMSQSGAEALKWYRLAADQGHATAQFNLGRLYVVGRDISQDYVQAYRWFTLAEVGFPDFDVKARARAIKAREVISPMMTPAQIDEAQRLASQ